MREINQKGLELLKSLERLKLNPYLDSVGVWTVGYGHTGMDFAHNTDSPITVDQAIAFLKADLSKIYPLENTLARPATDNEYAAMVCLAFNIGLEEFISSHVLSFFNAGLPVDGAWKLWTKGHVYGQLVTIHGLVNRREAELKLFHDTED